MDLSLEWVPRDQNEEADSLTNLDFGAFSEENRVQVDPCAANWLVLPEMLAAAEHLYAEAKAAKSAGSPAKRARTAPGGLRQSAPW